jgi:hypothetical protein
MVQAGARIWSGSRDMRFDDDFSWHRPYFAVSPTGFSYCSLGCGSRGAVELGSIAWIRKRYMDTPLLQAIFQVVLAS